MPAFRFRLQRVLDLRVIDEKEALTELGAAVRRMEDAEGLIEELKTRSRQALDDLQMLMTAESLDVRELAHHVKALDHLDSVIQRSEIDAAQARQQMSDAQDKVMEARAERRAFEILREKALREHEREAGRSEMRRMDEVASNRHVQTRRRAST